jgi:TonB family protein
VNVPSSTLVARRASSAWLVHAGGLAGGLTFTGAIMVGLAYFSRPPETPPEEEEEEYAVVDIPDAPPPPPPVATTRTATAPPLPMIFEEAPSTSTVRIAPTPLPINPLMMEVRPSFSLRYDFNPGEFRPDSGSWEQNVDHVFQRSEVDQVAVPIYRKKPEVSAALLKQVKNPRVRVLMTVNIDGSVEDVRLIKGEHPEFDRLVVEAIREWRFRPAMRKGRKVRQLAELPLYMKPPTSNPFSTN